MTPPPAERLLAVARALTARLYAYLASMHPAAAGIVLALSMVTVCTAALAVAVLSVALVALTTLAAAGLLARHGAIALATRTRRACRRAA